MLINEGNGFLSLVQVEVNFRSDKG